MLCPSCAEKVSSTDSECPYCGEKLRRSPASKNGSKKRRKGNGNSGGGSSGGQTMLIIAAVVFGGWFVCGGIMAALLMPAVQQAREAARRTQCKNNLKQIGLAMHNYHDTYMLFPAAHLNDQQGQPKLSWRVSILPYVDQAPLYNMYNFNEAWDGPSNSRFLNPLPPVYGCPSYPSTGPNTCYATITGDHTVLGAGKCVKMMDVTDGTSNTLMVVEACQLNIPWMKPQDIDAATVTRFGDPNGASSKHTAGLHVLLTDGSVRFVSVTTSPDVIKALIDRDGGTIVPDF